MNEKITQILCVFTSRLVIVAVDSKTRIKWKERLQKLV